MTLVHKMERKGWKRHELAHLDILTSKYTEKHRTEDIWLYRFRIIFLTIVEIVISVFFIPIFLIAPNALLALILFALGLVFGFLFEHLIIGLEHLEPKHHLRAAIIIPLVGVVNLLLFMAAGNGLKKVWPVAPQQGIILPAAVFLVGFFIPYTWHLWMNKQDTHTT
jgi:hypothetical protein